MGVQIVQKQNAALKLTTSLTQFLKQLKDAHGTNIEYVEGYTAEDKYPEHCRYIIEQLRSLGYNCIIKGEEKQFVSLWLEK